MGNVCACSQGIMGNGYGSLCMAARYYVGKMYEKGACGINASSFLHLRLTNKQHKMSN